MSQGRLPWALAVLIYDFQATGFLRGEKKRGKCSQVGVERGRCGHVWSAWVFLGAALARFSGGYGAVVSHVLTSETLMLDFDDQLPGLPSHPIPALPLTSYGTWDIIHFLSLSFFIQKVGGGPG